MNWGKGIAIFLTVFVIFILGLVYLTTRSTFDLEAEDYYAQEIAYQQRIDALGLGSTYADDFEVIEQDDRLLITLRADSQVDLQSATVVFYRPNDSRLDRLYDLTFTSGEASVSKEELVKGRYELRMEWMSGGELHAITKELSVN